jgi:hypothetical protein
LWADLLWVSRLQVVLLLVLQQGQELVWVQGLVGYQVVLWALGCLLCLVLLVCQDLLGLWVLLTHWAFLIL